MRRLENVLITGGTGFLGRHLIDALPPDCHKTVTSRNTVWSNDVVRLARGATTELPMVQGPSHIPNVTTWRGVDLRDQKKAHDVISSFRGDTIFHLAATAGGIGANRAAPGEFFYDNILMGINVLEAARCHPNKPKVVLVSTVCSYPKHCQTPFREETIWDGYPEETNAPYAIAKKALMEMARAYRAQYGCDFITLLPANLYGPYDNFDLEKSHVIPALVRKFVTARMNGDEHVGLWGTGQASREFLYAGDAARALVLAAERYSSDEPINVGNGTEVTIEQLAAIIRFIVGYSGNLHWDAGRPDGQPRRCLDVSKARERFGFEAQVGLEDGLRQTIHWFCTRNKVPLHVGDLFPGLKY